MILLTLTDTDTGLAIGFILLVLWLAFVLWGVYYLFIDYGRLGEPEHFERRKRLVMRMEQEGVPRPCWVAGRFIVFDFGDMGVTLVDEESKWYAYKDEESYVCTFRSGISDTRIYNRGLELLREAARGEVPA